MASRRTIPGFHVVVLAGGSGTRFWPLSRVDRPKQFLDLLGDDSLLQSTWKRARRLAPPSRIWIAAPARLVEPIVDMLPGFRRDNLIVEPVPRDTAPAIALACATVHARHRGAVVGIFPSDHVVRDDVSFVDAVRTAVDAAACGSLLCLGVRPDRAATGFGYLRCAEPPTPGRAVRVARFVEKPALAAARRYVRSGRYLWNAGMFVWQAESFLDEVRAVAPDILGAVTGHLDGNVRAWRRARKISVDYAVMERAADVRVVPLDAGWDDVGSWEAVSRLRSGGGRRVREILVDSPGSVVFAEDRLVAVVGAPDVTVVDTPDAVLVVSRKSAERVRDVIAELRRRGWKSWL